MSARYRLLQDVYSTVVPTLFDSTKAGIKWSVFMVSGLTAIPAVYAVTAPDSGYSIDNLAPAAPGNVHDLRWGYDAGATGRSDE